MTRPFWYAGVMRSRLLFSSWVIGSVLLSSSMVHAANTSTLGSSLDLQATLRSIGVTASVTGDDNGNATIKLGFRKMGEANFLPGHRLLPVSGNRAIGSALFLEPGTNYEIRVTLDDPDNGAPQEASGTVRTRDDMPPAQGSKHLYVNAQTGSDSNDGSQGKPFQTIQVAADASGPGTVLHVAAGIYRESVIVDGAHGGAKDNPLWIVADQGAILDGSDPLLEDGSQYVSEGNGIYSIPFAGESVYVAVDDTRLYDYTSLADLDMAAAGLSGGYFVGGGKLYLKLPTGLSPAGHKIHVGILDTAILLDTVSDVIVEGFEIRYYGATEGTGIDVRDTARSWIRKNMIHHLGGGIRVRKPLADDNVVEDNEIWDTSVWNWPWAASKGHTPESSAITNYGGARNVIRRNHTRGVFNGVYVGSFDDPSEAIAANTDVYENVLLQHADDALEPEGACVNVRFWNNVIREVHHGLSLAPIVVGPLFSVRNVIDRYQAHPLKVNNGPTGWILVYHTTSRPEMGFDAAQAIEPTEPFKGLITRNNIWAAHRYAIESAVTPLGVADLDRDNLWTDSADGTPRFVKWLNVKYADISELKASNMIEKNGFQVEPKYENPDFFDFTLVEGSPLLDVGEVIEGINDRFIIGAGPDIGAFERGGANPLPDGGLPDGGGTGGNGVGGGPSGGGGGAGGGGGNGETPGDTGSCGCRLGAESAGATLWGASAFVIGLLLRRRKAKRIIGAPPRR